VPFGVDERAETLARTVIERMGGVGLFCLELFLLPDAVVLINEVAPRPHNSGIIRLMPVVSPSSNNKSERCAVCP
jgi:phosphoribosylaminoimidazole carboxylase (NCAIR synthetase)